MRVLLTGASSGVGLAAARVFAAAGHDLALVARHPEGLETAARVVRGHGRRAVALPCDVSDAEAVDAAVARAERELGGIDAVVANQAAPVFGPFEQVPKRDFDRCVDVTFLGTVNLARSALPALERSHGVFVATGSLMAKVPLPTFSAYAASKHALRGFLNSLRVELRARRSPVRVAMLHPGSIDTPFWRHATSSTGKQPRLPPEGYRPEVVARGLLELAERPRAEVTIGAEGKAIELGWRLFRPGGDLLLRAVHHWYLSGRKPAPEPNALWEPRGEGWEETGPMIGRPSLTAALRWKLRAPRLLRR
ncbi:MAG TPA: SDR family NAD(P)-dependent oxidoreductase [Solirubrobacteraceae bacterium]|nr:SDR family NAD(P)-dependent oxidoreductase [Solirubrobacteraceae bacterium]